MSQPTSILSSVLPFLAVILLLGAITVCFLLYLKRKDADQNLSSNSHYWDENTTAPHNPDDYLFDEDDGELQAILEEKLAPDSEQQNANAETPGAVDGQTDHEPTTELPDDPATKASEATGISQEMIVEMLAAVDDYKRRAEEEEDANISLSDDGGNKAARLVQDQLRDDSGRTEKFFQTNDNVVDPETTLGAANAGGQQASRVGANYNNEEQVALHNQLQQQAKRIHELEQQSPAAWQHRTQQQITSLGRSIVARNAEIEQLAIDYRKQIAAAAKDSRNDPSAAHERLEGCKIIKLKIKLQGQGLERERISLRQHTMVFRTLRMPYSSHVATLLGLVEQTQSLQSANTELSEKLERLTRQYEIVFNRLQALEQANSDSLKTKPRLRAIAGSGEHYTSQISDHYTEQYRDNYGDPNNDGSYAANQPRLPDRPPADPDDRE